MTIKDEQVKNTAHAVLSNIVLSLRACADNVLFAENKDELLDALWRAMNALDEEVSFKAIRNLRNKLNEKETDKSH